MQTYQTNDRDLALALATAGCIPEPQETGGPAINLYTPNLLRDWGYIRGSVSIKEFEAVVTMCTTGGLLPDGRKIGKRLGIVIYSFVRDKTCERALKAWNDCADEMLKAKNENREPRLADLTPEQIMQACHGRRMNTELLNKLGWVRRPECAIGGVQTNDNPLPNTNPLTKRESHLPAPKTQGVGSMKRWTLGCSEEMRKRLKLDEK